jgi:hypothetical protein
MVIEILALSAAFTAGATVLLLVAGRWELPGYLSRVAVIGGLALVIGQVSAIPWNVRSRTTRPTRCCSSRGWCSACR